MLPSEVNAVMRTSLRKTTAIRLITIYVTVASDVAYARSTVCTLDSTEPSLIPA
jgi:hypothetical protein